MSKKVSYTLSELSTVVSKFHWFLTHALLLLGREHEPDGGRDREPQLGVRAVRGWLVTESVMALIVAIHGVK